MKLYFNSCTTVVYCTNFNLTFQKFIYIIFNNFLQQNMSLLEEESISVESVGIKEDSQILIEGNID